MSFKKSRRLWVAVPVLLAASWVTARVVTADPAAPRAARAAAAAAAAPPALELTDVRNPALEQMISRFAAEARAQQIARR